MLKKILVFALVLCFLTGLVPFKTVEAYTGSNYYNYYYRYSPFYYYRYSTQNYLSNNTELRYGSVGEEVKEVQGYLRTLGYDLKTEDGKYGYYTYKAVLDFQRKNGLLATGRVDVKTLNLLKEAAAEVNNSKPIPQPVTPRPEKPANPPVSDKPANPPASDNNSELQGLTADEKQMLDLVNNERTKKGLAPLKVDMELVRLARMKSKDMIDNNYFSHTSPTYGSPFEMMKNAGVSYRIAGENLAGAHSVTTAHTNLMNSSGHRANILNSAYTHIGIGIVDGGRYGKMFTQLFVGR